MSLVEQLEAELDEPDPEPWRPKAGEKLVGEIKDIRKAPSRYADPYLIVTVRTENGEYWAFSAYHKVAREALAGLNPQCGDVIAIRYDGKKGDRAYEFYKILVRHADGTVVEPNWDAIQKEGDAEPERDYPDEGEF
jgi:hypothetical protein